MTEREKLIGLINKGLFEWGASTAGYPAIEYLADHLVANGVIVPPCKVGDKVYVADNGGIREATANEMYFHGGDDWCILLSFDCDYECENCPFSSWSQEYSGEYSCGGEYGCWDIEFKDFGKTVFLTKEEAEKALKEKQE